MFLSSVQLHGFKSYANHTVFEFGPGLNEIVGPARCGKTAVLEAIRWALGEPSLAVLRAASPAELIFAGTASRPPMAQAIVSLHFSDCPKAWNCPENQLRITRQTNRRGEEKFTGEDATLDAVSILQRLAEAAVQSDRILIEPASHDRAAFERPLLLFDEYESGFDAAALNNYRQFLEESRAVRQLIVVTSDRRTMSLANAMHGITMEEWGISKRVEMRRIENT
jgi:chromosome segregation ATPase